MTHELIDTKRVASVLASAPSEEPVVSLYIQTDGRHVADLKLSLKQLVKEGEKSILADRALDERQRKQATAALERVQAAAAEALGTPARGTFVGFGWGNRVESFRAPIALEERILIGRAPHALPLVTALEEHERYGVVLVDMRRGRVFDYSLGELNEIADLANEGEQDIAWAGWLGRDQLRMSHHHEYVLHRHLQRVADWVFAQHRKEAFDRLVLGGHADLSGKLERYLHPSLAARVIARESWTPDTAKNDIRRRLGEIDERVETEKEKMLLANVRDHLAGDLLATTGYDDTLRSLSDGKVATLLIAAGAIHRGRACPFCRFLFLSPHDEREAASFGILCPRCDGLARAVPNIVESAVEVALLTAAKLKRISRATAELDALGGVASILRFR